MKNNLILTLIAGIIFCSCDNKEKQIDEALSKAVACAELGTVEYTITKLIITDDDSFFKFGDRKIIFSCRTTMKAGIDLKEFTKEDVKVSEDNKSVEVNLPHPKVLSFNMAAEDIKLEYSKVSGLRTDFNTDERNDLLKQGEKAILDDAPNLGIYEDAKENASDFFKALLANCGFENVNVSFKDDEKQ
ncbi:MAG: DUF4230 domain-containing protein [Bacteroidaceae bacterium]|nr:DUF4230 domain-containing protein [Bacteroidaceae bacterium]